MKKEFTKKEYENYMKVVDDYIKRAKIIINDLHNLEEVRRLSYEGWVKFQSGEKNK